MRVKPKQISRKFTEEMQIGNVKRASKLLTNNIQHGILSLNEETILTLKLKHHQTVNPEPDVLPPDGAPNAYHSS